MQWKMGLAPREGLVVPREVGALGGGGGSSTWPEAQDKHGLEVRVVRRQCLGAQAVWAYDH